MGIYLGGPIIEGLFVCKIWGGELIFGGGGGVGQGLFSWDLVIGVLWYVTLFGTEGVC